MAWLSLVYVRRGPCTAVFCGPIHQQHREVKKASGGCLGGEGGRRGEGCLLSVENQNGCALGAEQEQASVAPRKDKGYVQQKAQGATEDTSRIQSLLLTRQISLSG